MSIQKASHQLRLSVRICRGSLGRVAELWDNVRTAAAESRLAADLERGSAGKDRPTDSPAWPGLKR